MQLFDYRMLYDRDLEYTSEKYCNKNRNIIQGLQIHVSIRSNDKDHNNLPTHQIAI